MCRVISICILLSSCNIYKQECNTEINAVEEFVIWFKSKNPSRLQPVFIDQLLSNSILRNKALKHTLLAYASDIDVKSLLELPEVPLANLESKGYQVADLKEFQSQEGYKWDEQNGVQISLPIQTKIKDEFLLLAYSNNSVEEIGYIFTFKVNDNCNILSFELVDTFLRMVEDS